jgi:hypothetical protein
MAGITDLIRAIFTQMIMASKGLGCRTPYIKRFYSGRSREIGDGAVLHIC